MSKLLITCKETTLISIKNEEHASSFSERMHFWIHLLICSYCRLFNNQSHILSHHLKSISLNAELTTEEKLLLIEKIKEQIQK